MDEEKRTIRKLYRSRMDRKLGGVCGGFGEYFEIDPVIVRLIFVALIFWGGIGLFAYLVALIVVPNNPKQ